MKNKVEDGLVGRRILVVEDETVVALVIEETIGDMGCKIVGPAYRLDAALRLATEEDLDGAILDVSIRDQKVYPVADRLQARGIPFILATGYGDRALPDHLRNSPRLTKPFTVEALQMQVRSLCGQAGSIARS